jgi:hypothetical protein
VLWPSLKLCMLCVVLLQVCFIKISNRPSANVTFHSCNTSFAVDLSNITPKPAFSRCVCCCQATVCRPYCTTAAVQQQQQQQQCLVAEATCQP